MGGAVAKTPLVGLSTYSVDADWKAWADNSSLTPNSYVRCLATSGAVPVLLPSLGPAVSAPDRLLDALDAVVLIGGGDVCGRRSGRDEDAAAHAAHSDQRDDFEIALAQGAWERDLPLLGICRGMQVLNVARGGTLIEDLASAGASSEHLIDRGVFNRHAVEFEPGSRAAEMFGPRTVVPSHHHQAVDRLGEGLVTTGVAEDAVIESVEGSGKHFVLGVQWHPEEGEDMTLFEALVEATAVRR